MTVEHINNHKEPWDLACRALRNLRVGLKVIGESPKVKSRKTIKEAELLWDGGRKGVRIQEENGDVSIMLTTNQGWCRLDELKEYIVFMRAVTGNYSLEERIPLAIAFVGRLPEPKLVGNK